MSDIETAKRLFLDGLGFLNTHDFISAELRFREALTLTPKSVPVLTNLAVALFAQDKVTEALEFSKRAIASDGNNIEAHLIIANCFAKKRHFTEALASCDKIIALEPTLAETYVNRAVALIELNRPEESLDSCNRAIAMLPNLADAYYNRGRALIRLGRHQEAIASHDKAIALQPDLAKAWMERGNIFVELKRRDEAAAAYAKALSINPDIEEAEGACLHLKMYSCDWSNFEDGCSRVLAGGRKGLPVAPPFVILGIPSTPADQLKCAKSYAARVFPDSDNSLWQSKIYSHDRIRVGYLSANFNDHPVAYLTVGILECHDKSRFETIGISFGPPSASAITERIRVACDRFIDVRTRSDGQIAEIICEMEIDILVDLMGFTQDSRPNILAMRAAPIQINYLGFPGTMGANFMDYIIADHTVIPQAFQHHYAEKVIYMPETFQSNERKHRAVSKSFSRADAGLSESAFVFCCFNSNYKITPVVFDSWMRILRRIDNSVLWLSVDNPVAADNLRREAQTRGVAAERLIFAPRVSFADYLARLRVADLFLDTLPYNAGATAGDALWTGLPILTRIGETFAGRMGASLLNTVGLQELITSSAEDYETRAIALASDSSKIAAIKRKLGDRRLTTPLFDSARFTRHLERAYLAIHARHQCGEPPATFDVERLASD
jgi:protein O-GlcNAc transferase